MKILGKEIDVFLTICYLILGVVAIYFVHGYYFQYVTRQECKKVIENEYYFLEKDVVGDVCACSCSGFPIGYDKQTGERILNILENNNVEDLNFSFSDNVLYGSETKVKCVRDALRDAGMTLSEFRRNIQ